MPLKIEPNIYSWLLQNRSKHNIFLPFMENISFKMVKFRLPLESKRFGLFEPKNSFNTKAKLDVAIVPVVGVDGNYQRIGFGKGMYDRFFEKLNYNVLTIFVQAHSCKTDKKICNDYDIKADILITPNNFIWINR
jgi:5-formyltetrahydrofolate cyclo-ligase